MTIGGEAAAGLPGGASTVLLTAGASGSMAAAALPKGLSSPPSQGRYACLVEDSISQDKIPVTWPTRHWPCQLLSLVCALFTHPAELLLQVLDHITLFPPLDRPVHWAPCLEHHFATQCLAGAFSSFRCQLRYCS